MSKDIVAVAGLVKNEFHQDEKKFRETQGHDAQGL